MINKYSLAAILITIFVIFFYFCNFYLKLNYSISADAAVWGQLGDYVGGLLNPSLSFISIMLLIKSLTLQNHANQELRAQIKSSEKSEKIRSFEDQLFSMIDAQKTNFKSMRIRLRVNGKKVVRQGDEAVIEIEDEIARIRDFNGDDAEVQEYLKQLEIGDQIYNATRIFYIMVKLISEKISDSQGFDIEDRRSYMITLINFTDFALLRLIMMSIQFMDYSIVEYLKSNEDFNFSLSQVNINYELY